MNDDRSIEERFCDREASLEAVKRGVRRALWRHKRLGQSVAVWRDDRVVLLAPQDIPVDSPE